MELLQSLNPGKVGSIHGQENVATSAMASVDGVFPNRFSGDKAKPMDWSLSVNAAVVVVAKRSKSI